MQTGSIKLGSNNLMVIAGGSLTGGSSNSYVMADGTGVLMMHLVAGSTDSFKVGTTSNFTPIAIKANSGSATGDVSVNVIGDVYTGGTTGVSLAATKALVKNTWHVSSSATSGINYDMTAMWGASIEVNGFNRTHAFISHYTSGAWDMQTPTTATASGSMYMITRAGLTSLSPFMVADNTTLSEGIKPVTASSSEIILYPNPVTTTLYFATPAPINTVYIYNIYGKLVLMESIKDNNISVAGLPAGVYTVRMLGNNFTSYKTFIKQ
jgi:pectate lyase